MSLSKISRDVIGTALGRSVFHLNEGARPNGPYPLELEYTLKHEALFYSPKDDFGVPVKRFKKFGVQYNPTRVAAFALSHYNRFARGQYESLAPFLQMADWFLAQRDGRFEYMFTMKGLRAPWISGMAQGEAMSVLTRAHELSPEKGYLEHAMRAARPLDLNIEKGGVRSKIAGQWDFLEEHPTVSPPHTLNGFLYAMVGILDLIDLEPSMKRFLGFGDLMETISRKWQLWDINGWSAYDLERAKGGRRNPATINYHEIHIALTRYIGEVTDRAELLECSRAWTKNKEQALNRLKAVVGKIRYRSQVPAER